MKKYFFIRTSAFVIQTKEGCLPIFFFCLELSMKSIVFFVCHTVLPPPLLYTSLPYTPPTLALFYPSIKRWTQKSKYSFPPLFDVTKNTTNLNDIFRKAQVQSNFLPMMQFWEFVFKFSKGTTYLFTFFLSNETAWSK